MNNSNQKKEQGEKVISEKEKASQLSIKADKKSVRNDNIKVDYKSVDKKSFFEIISESVPKQFLPTIRSLYIFSIILIIVLILSLFAFPYGKMMSGDADINITIGIPWTFFELQLLRPLENPLRIGPLIMDFFLYLFVSYLIDILINIILEVPLLETEEEKKRRPKLYERKELKESKDPSERLTRKIFESKERFYNNLPKNK